MTGLSLPVGDLERGADEDAGQVEQLLEQNQELQSTVSALERHYDAISQAAAEGAELDDLLATADGTEDATFPDWERVLMDSEDHSFPESERLSEDEDTFADAIGEAIESYLRTQSKAKRRHEAGLNATEERASAGSAPADGAALDPQEDFERPRPRHRAPRPWESKDEAPGEADSDPGGEA